jgi:hypothetical protein
MIRPAREPARRRPRDQAETVRRLTAGVAVTAVAANAILFLETAVQQEGAGAVQAAMVAVLSGLFPSGGLRAPAVQPTPAESPGVATSGGS